MDAGLPLCGGSTAKVTPFPPSLITLQSSLSGDLLWTVKMTEVTLSGSELRPKGQVCFCLLSWTPAAVSKQACAVH